MLKKTAVLAVVLMAAATNVQAQSCSDHSGAGCSVNTTATVTIPSLVELTVGGGGSIALTAPTVSDLAVGYVQDAGPAITVRSNRSWTLSIHTTNAANWDYVGTEGGVKPISDFTWSTVAGGPYTAITNTAAPIVTGQPRTNAGSPTIFFRTLYTDDLGDPSMAAGDYSLPLVFTLTAP